ncbi:putative CbiG-like cobalamin biosynthesis protein [Rhodococcus sp. AW25M09]|uniref:cobalamin biosynthesis protein n=1 Tax=Rhodococcus sp. AW25M09 TaxID=1268303 RepID=UPI0002AC82DB|nr:cobalamin biosynthesis protein [Rhodococcus sp. AW25M09]CCQ16837.1 putative CbiG-like cobalamin biosynthesis protein [Rhodococcus sp. AW25M09]
MRVVVGIGARMGVDAADVMRVISTVLQQNWQVEAIASIDRKAELVAAVAASMGVRGLTYSAEQLSAVPTATNSQRVQDAVGSASVAVASVLLAGAAGQLLVPRTVDGRVVVAVAEAAANLSR